MKINGRRERRRPRRILAGIHALEHELQDLDDLIRISGDHLARAAAFLETGLSDDHSGRAIGEGRIERGLNLLPGIAASVSTNDNGGYSHGTAAGVKVPSNPYA